MTVEQLLDNISAKELLEWQVYDRISPIGSKRLDLTAAHILHTIYSFLVGGEKNTLYTEELALDFEVPYLSDEEIEKRKQFIMEHKEQAKIKKNFGDMDALINRFKGIQGS